MPGMFGLDQLGEEYDPVGCERRRKEAKDEAAKKVAEEKARVKAAKKFTAKDIDDLNERLLQVAGHAFGKILDRYKRRTRKGKELDTLHLLEETARNLTVLTLMAAQGKLR